MSLARASLGQGVARVVAAALCIAATAGIVAIVSGGFGDGEWRVIATSMLFALAASTGASGAELIRRQRQAAVVLGSGVLVASIAAFLVIAVGIWIRSESEDLWRVAGVIGILAVDGAHASFVLARARRDDPDSAGLATSAAVAASATSAVMGILAVSGLVEHGPWQPLAVVLIIQLLATALAPVLRRTGATGATNVMRSAELLALADELERGPLKVEARPLAERLRRLGEQ